MKIRAAVFREPGVPFSVEELDLQDPRQGEVLVKIAATGVCHSDWHLMTGATHHPAPVVVGHEGAGVVHEVGPEVSGLATGDHVALSWAPNCGQCFYCAKGRPSLCQAYLEPIWAGTMMDGTTRLSQNGAPVYHFSALACFAEYAIVPEQCCVRMPQDVPLEIAALIGCAVTTGVGAVLNTAKVEKGSSVVIIGAGGVGLSTLLGANLAGAEQIIVIDRTAARLALATTLGATATFLNSDDCGESVRSLTAGRGADYVFEAVGSPSLQELAFDLTRPGGTTILAGISAMGSATNLPGSLITRQEKTIMGSYYGTCDPARDFPAYAQLYREGKLPLDRLIGKRYPLEQINDAYQHMLEGAGGRGIVTF
jgi:S-(hydroxymethyl)glutathione dehydrogenase / alcohol dehydrogenase